MCCCIDISHVLLYGYEPCVVVWIWVICYCMHGYGSCVVVPDMCCRMDMCHLLLYGFVSCVVDIMCMSIGSMPLHIYT